MRLDRRLTHGFTAQVSFTYSKTLDNSSGSVAGDNSSFDFTSTPWYDLSLNKGLSDFNVGKNLTINASCTSPTVKSLGAFGTRALCGGQLRGLVSSASGIPLSPTIP